MDQGGELYNNPKVVKLLESFGYDVLPTGADLAHQNGLIERANGSIAGSIRAILHGAGLPVKFWPYAFKYFLRVDNALPHRKFGQTRSTKSPFEIVYKQKDDFT